MEWFRLEKTLKTTKPKAEPGTKATKHCPQAPLLAATIHGGLQKPNQPQVVAFFADPADGFWCHHFFWRGPHVLFLYLESPAEGGSDKVVAEAEDRGRRLCHSPWELLIPGIVAPSSQDLLWNSLRQTLTPVVNGKRHKWAGKMSKKRMEKLLKWNCRFLNLDWGHLAALNPMCVEVFPSQEKCSVELFPSKTSWAEGGFNSRPLQRLLEIP